MLRPAVYTCRCHRRAFHATRSATSPLDVAHVALQTVHAATGASWAATIPLVTLGISVLTIPIAVRSRRNQIRLAALRPLVQAQQATLAKQARATAIDTRSFQRELKRLQRDFRRTLHKRHGVNLLSILALPALKIPLWLCFSFTLRSMAGMDIPFLEGVETEEGFKVEGLLWMQDLTRPDMMLSLPVLFGLANLLNVELNSAKGASLLGRVLGNIGRCLAIVFIPIAAQMPAALCLYWTTSAVFTLAQNLVLNQIWPVDR
ncbi:membrane insertase OXA1/ALB3/YidC [Protomyces lactucae-debilis]|uniref:Membrane insertase OXA1/ALB3/YidC n=1 Tax=Protomyces lactucae-debilis TaxID=2754530 RepID=A0A1Y2F1T4_PROLT|nr:membrane insertase OXA1/ALB3/YidC [Protomyces lactucae-debilis]ORY77829.1 membrane insertase OXA1/ALB3/YidC [Protomyces lactucae-debilis]